MLELSCILFNNWFSAFINYNCKILIINIMNQNLLVSLFIFVSLAVSQQSETP